MIFKTPNKLVTNFCLHFESKVNWIIIVMKMRIPERECRIVKQVREKGRINDKKIQYC